jgi:hypothetical protein
MLLSPHFTFAEMVYSETAQKHGISNTPPPEALKNMQVLCNEVLEPIRNLVGKPIVINSGYRCLALNRLLGSKDPSQHVKGAAADIECPGISNLELAELIFKSTIPWDQLILENYKPGDPASGWVHVSTATRPRRQVLTFTNGRYITGLPNLISINGGNVDV